MPELQLPSQRLDQEAITLPMVARAVAEDVAPDALPGIVIADIVKRDVLYIISVMLRPEQSFDHYRLGRDADLQHAHQALLTAGRARMFADLSVYPDLQERYADPAKLIAETMSGPRLAGYAAAWILRWVIRRHAGGQRPSASGVGKAFEAFQGHCEQHCKSGGTVEHLKKNIWPRFRSVAHFWAALYRLTEYKQELLDPAGLALFMGTAAAYLERGCAIIPLQAHQSVLNRVTAWTVPDCWTDRTTNGQITNALQLG